MPSEIKIIFFGLILCFIMISTSDATNIERKAHMASKGIVNKNQDTKLVNNQLLNIFKSVINVPSEKETKFKLEKERKRMEKLKKENELRQFIYSSYLASRHKGTSLLRDFLSNRPI